jgi:triacylglycerol lipase
MRFAGPARRIVSLVLLMNLFASSGRATPTETNAVPETVVLLHGIGLRSWSMWRVESNLRREGYRVVNLTYPSRRISLERLGREWLPAQLSQRGLTGDGRVHFVTHSMGGIVVRAWLRDRGVPTNLGNVVMLAPPNHGSAAADRMTKSAPFRWFMGPNLRLLGTGADSFPLALGPWPAPASKLGVIAGDRTINPLFSSWLRAPNDGAVTVDSARLEGMSDFTVLHHSHTLLAWRSDTLNAVRTFLRTGNFPSSHTPEKIQASFAK